MGKLAGEVVDLEHGFRDRHDRLFEPRLRVEITISLPVRTSLNAERGQNNPVAAGSMDARSEPPVLQCLSDRRCI
jgi:hypothetical protein